MSNEQLAELCGEVMTEALALRDFLAGDPELGEEVAERLNSYLRDAHGGLWWAAYIVARASPAPAGEGREG